MVVSFGVVERGTSGGAMKWFQRGSRGGRAQPGIPLSVKKCGAPPFLAGAGQPGSWSGPPLGLRPVRARDMLEIGQNRRASFSNMKSILPISTCRFVNTTFGSHNLKVNQQLNRWEKLYNRIYKKLCYNKVKKNIVC